MTDPAKKILDLAAKEVGYHEGRSGGHWNNDQKYSDEVPGMKWSDGQAWCATFVSWLALKAGVASLYPRTASCLAGVTWFKDRKQFSEYPAVGAQVFYGPGGGTHTGIVYDFDSTYIYTIEGNTNAGGSAEGDGVYRKKRERRAANTYGYGYPAFPEGLRSADPSYKKPASSTNQNPTTPKLGISGIDVSSHQSETYPLTGADFVVVKATEGDAYTNPKHTAQVKRARDAKLVVGHYHFARPGDMKAQADRFLKTAAPKPGEFLALDWEDSDVSCADKDEFLKYLVSKAGGRKVLLYCNTTFWLNKDTTSYVADGLWIAKYSGTAGSPGIEHEWLMHQHTDKPIDTNVTRWATRKAMQTWAAPATPKPAPPKETPVTVPQTFKDVWNVDAVPAPPSASTYATNKTWKAGAYLMESYERIHELLDKVDALSDRLAAIEARL